MEPVQYTSTPDEIAVVTMDDGKVNALSPRMLDALNEAFDRADARRERAVVLAGRSGVFSAGFDLRVLATGGVEAERMLRDGFLTAERMLRSPRPIVVAGTGHTFAMAVFLLSSADYRVGADDRSTIQANEVAIGLTMPHAGVSILRHRLSPAAFERATTLAEAFDPAAAVAAGLLDEVVAPERVVDRALEVAVRLAELDPAAHAATKLRARSPLLAVLAEEIAAEFGTTA